jgi:putative hydrolase of HD superfamily
MVSPSAHGISHARVVARNLSPIKSGCPALWVYLEVEFDVARGKGFFGT